MTKPIDIREIAYETWKEMGCPRLSAPVWRKMKEKGYVLSDASVRNWRKQYDWDRRAAREIAEAKRIADASDYQNMLEALIDRKLEFERHFQTLPADQPRDNQSIYAYNNIVRTILDIKDRQRTDASVIGQDTDIRTPAEAIDALWEAVRKKVGRATSEPEKLTAEVIKDINSSMTLLERIQSRHPEPETPDDDKNTELSDETKKKIREQLYGLT